MTTWSVFLQKEVLEISFSGVRYKQLICIVVDRCFLRSQTGLNMPRRAMGAGGVDGRERHGTRAMVARNSTEWLVVIWNRENPLFSAHCE